MEFATKKPFQNLMTDIYETLLQRVQTEQFPSIELFQMRKCRQNLNLCRSVIFLLCRRPDLVSCPRILAGCLSVLFWLTCLVLVDLSCFGWLFNTVRLCFLGVVSSDILCQGRAGEGGDLHGVVTVVG